MRWNTITALFVELFSLRDMAEYDRMRWKERRKGVIRHDVYPLL
jgi:hypothetical protein